MCESNSIFNSFAEKSMKIFGKQFDYLDYVRNNESRHYSAVLRCKKHDVVFTVDGSNHLRYKTGGCPNCASESRVESKYSHLYDGKKRQCSRCKEFKPLEDNFYWEPRGKWSARCNDCKREVDRQRSKTDKAKARNKRARDRYNSKVKEQGFFSRLLSSLSKPVYHRTCAKCGKKEVLKKEPVGRSVDYCSDCYRTIGTNTGKKIHKDATVKCSTCGHDYIGKNMGVKTCPTCKEARKKQSKKINKQRFGSSFRSRARAYGVAYEQVDRIKVYERDKWRCMDCGVKVHPYKGVIKDNTATLGHLVPMSLGGSHTYANVRCECWKCNTFKGNKAYGQQITFFDNVSD